LLNKIAIVGGAGRVGEASALYLMQQSLCRELVIIDSAERVAEGVALDLAESAAVCRSDMRLWASASHADVAGSELVIVTAGRPRRPGWSRSDILDENLEVMDGIAEATACHAPEALMLVVTNPVDLMTYRALQRTGWPRHRVFGHAGVLDASRMAWFVAQELECSMNDIDGLVLGSHGSKMVPMTRHTTFKGLSIEQFLSAEQIRAIVDRTRDAGAEVLLLREHSSAYLAPAAAIAEMVESIARDRGRLLSTVARLEGEYGERDKTMGVPAMLDRNGIRRIVEVELDEVERAAFQRSASAVEADLAYIKSTVAA